MEGKRRNVPAEIEKLFSLQDIAGMTGTSKFSDPR